MFKRFFTKTRFTLITILSLLSITSVGFASWTITAFDVDEEVFGSLESDIVINNKELVYLDTTKGDIDINKSEDDENNKKGYNCFDYEKTGYLNSTKTAVVDTGYINAFFKIDVDKCYDYFKNYNSLKININLGYYNSNNTILNIFSMHDNADGERKSVVYTMSSTYSNIESSGSVINKSYVSDVLVQDIFVNYEYGSGQTIDFSITYEFFATTGSYFYNNIYKFLEQDAIDFEFEIRITGYNK